MPSWASKRGGGPPNDRAKQLGGVSALAFPPFGTTASGLLGGAVS